MIAPNHRMRTFRGFTLIELLVVIAIIGILSSVILASLALARLKGADANIKSNLHSIQLTMETIYDNNNPSSYGPTTAAPIAAQSVVSGATVFATDSKIKSQLQSAYNQGGSMYYWVGVNGATYAVAVKLKSDSTNWWCMDSNYGARTRPAALFTGSALGTTGGPAACP
jgi:prepilin-type N-terminal cleavage/methylation domain-containing protein